MSTNATNLLQMSGKMGDLKRRLFFLLGALIVYRVGAHIPVPGIDPVALAELFKSQKGGILDMFNMFSGGALSRFTILALGIMPYISASIAEEKAKAGAEAEAKPKVKKAKPAADAQPAKQAAKPAKGAKDGAGKKKG